MGLSSYPYWCTTSLDALLPIPHYSEPFWCAQEREVFRLPDPTKAVSATNYHDRLWQWDWTSAERAQRSCQSMRNTAARCQRWLTVYHRRDVTLIWIKAGIHLSSAYPVWCYGYQLGAVIDDVVPS